MPAEGLLQLLETLSKRIDAHGAALGQSETLTRYALIDPLLRELGWDTADPAMVMPEYGSPAAAANYALFAAGEPTPLVAVAAKALGDPLQDAVMPGILHCVTEGIRYFAATNGQAWDVYETHKPVPMDQKRVASFDLQSMTAAEARLQALALWRPNVLDGNVMPAQSHAAHIPDEATALGIMNTDSASHQTPEMSSGNWISLADLNPPTRGRPRPPSTITFPDGSSAPLGTWNKVMIETTKWLVVNGYLKDSGCSILGSDRGTRYIVSTTPKHSNNKPFKVKYRIDGLYLELDYTGSEFVNNAKTIIKRAGLDPADFKVRF